MGQWEVNERLKLHNLCIHHVMLRSELRYLIGAKALRCTWSVFGGKTGPVAMVQVFVWENQVQRSGTEQ